MKFKATHLLFLGVFVVILGLVYAVVFGDAGLWMRGELKEREALLQENIRELRRENRVLHRKYHDRRRTGFSAPRPAGGAGGIILKFDEGGGDIAANSTDAAENKGLSIHEARGLYGVGALFLLLLGIYLTGARGGAKIPAGVADRRA